MVGYPASYIRLPEESTTSIRDSLWVLATHQQLVWQHSDPQRAPLEVHNQVAPTLQDRGPHLIFVGSNSLKLVLALAQWIMRSIRSVQVSAHLEDQSAESSNSSIWALLKSAQFHQMFESVHGWIPRWTVLRTGTPTMQWRKERRPSTAAMLMAGLYREHQQHHCWLICLVWLVNREEPP